MKKRISVRRKNFLFILMESDRSAKFESNTTKEIGYIGYCTKLLGFTDDLKPFLIKILK